MTIATLSMPRLGETMEEGKLVAWLVKPGQPFRRGDPILEVETDKTVVEFPALGDGALSEALAQPGETISVGAPIARIELGTGPDWTATDRDEGADAAEDDPPGTIIVDLPMPQLGETMEEGKLVAWLVDPGQPFARGDPLVEVETDKTVAEFPALADGILIETLEPLGTMLNVGTPIARLRVAASDRASFAANGDAAEAERAADPASAPGAAKPVPPATGRVRATPVARRRARQLGIDLAGLTGTGRRGRIERADVEAADDGSGGDIRTGHGLAWLETGPANGTPVLMLHGFAADHTAWAALQSLLSRAGRRALATDLPGHGRATAEAATVADLSPPVAALVRDRFAATAPHVIAHSMGALVALALARDMAPASLTLIAPAGLGPARDPDFIEGLARAADVSDVAPRLSRMTEGPTGLSEAALAAIARDLARGRLTGLATDLMLPPSVIAETRAGLAALAERIPVRIILGHRDRITGWQDALTVSPRIAIHHLPEVGHMPHWEALPQVAAIVTEATA